VPRNRRFLVSALCGVAGACSLLAPSRDELTGGVATGGAAGALDGDGGSEMGGGGSDTGGGSGALAGEGPMSGGTGAGEAGSAGESSGGAGGALDTECSEPLDLPAPNVLPCTLGAVGEWQQITPAGATDGTFAMELDPQNSGALYVGSNFGLFKTTDCGTNWELANTGVEGVTVGSSSIRGMLIDPTDSQVIYVKSGDFIYKSTNGGVDWARIYPTDELNAVADYDAVLKIDMLRCNPQHLLFSFRDNCRDPYPSACYLESTDGGDSFEVREGDLAWDGNAGNKYWFVTPQVWVTLGGRGFWRTTNRGTSWLNLASNSIGEGRSSLYQADNGAYYLGTLSGILRSADGVLWTKLPSSGETVGGLWGDGTTLYRTDLSACFNWTTDPVQLFYSAPETTGTPWTSFPSAGMRQGAHDIRVDREKHVMYSSMCGAGLWRVVLE
jgi:hypothetical protein